MTVYFDSKNNSLGIKFQLFYNVSNHIITMVERLTRVPRCYAVLPWCYVTGMGNWASLTRYTLRHTLFYKNNFI